jgi:hypothetical protein
MLKTIDNPVQLKLDLFGDAVRVDIAPVVCHSRPQPLPNLKLTEKLEKLAAGMQKMIDNKLNPAISNQNITARRSRIATSMREEGQKLAVIQRWLQGLAQSHHSGNCPDLFAKINSRKQLEDLATIHNWQQEGSRYLHDCYAYGYSIVDRLVPFGIKSKDEAIDALELLESLCSGNPAPEIDRSFEKANELRRKAIYQKVPDFFPTPKAIIARMLEFANVQPHHCCLDPEGGAGDICLAVRALGVSAIDCFEINLDLHQALTLLGFQPHGRDFLAATPRPIYDRVLMNPPFGKDAYIDHVRAAYHWLAPGGELISVLPNGYRGSRIAKRREFTDWLDDLGADLYDNRSDAFIQSDRSCGVCTHLIHIKR